MRNSKMKGFTLIELIVVIAIIGVLAAILVPSMIGYVGQSKLSTANSNAKLAFTNSATYCTNCEVAGYTVVSGSATYNLAGGSATSGVATVVISEAGVPEKTAWAKTTSDKYVGGYPVAATAEKNSTASGETVVDLDTAEATTNS